MKEGHHSFTSELFNFNDTSHQVTIYAASIHFNKIPTRILKYEMQIC